MDRLLKTTWVLAAASLLVAGCGDEELPVYVQGSWQVRCPSGLPGCRDGEPHQLNGYADELMDGQSVSCEVGSAGSGKKSLTLLLRDGGDSLQLRRVVFDPDSGAVDRCQVFLDDGDNEYEARSENGDCGSGPPSSDGQRCQLQVRRGEDAGDGLGATLDVTLRCLSIVGPANPERLRRNVLAIRGSTEEPAFLRLANCPGF